MSETLVNLGCGLHAPAGWVNIDKSPSMLLDRLPGAKRLLGAIGVLEPGHMAKWPSNIRRHDITKPLPFVDGTVDAVYSSHTLEHVYFDEAARIVGECYRVLRPGGILRLALPDGRKWAEDLVNGVTVEKATPGMEFNHRLLAVPLERPTLKRRVVRLFGADFHRWQPTFDLVQHMLTEAGFVGISEQTYRVGRLPRIDEVEHRDESFFVEAVKP